VIKRELYGASSCPQTEEMREWLEWRGYEFIEYDVEADQASLDRMHELTNGQLITPVLVEDGKVTQVGWQGRGCVVSKGVSS
jgi:glutaredoxin 3